MTLKKPEDLEFLHSEPLSMRCISQGWVKRRGIEINSEEPDLETALHEALNQIFERMGDNLKEDTEVRVFPPENDTDPYIVVMPVDLRSGSDRRKAMAVSKPPEATEERFSDRSSLREDFESLLYETIEGLVLGRLERKESGDYYDKRILGMWKGFTLYHRGCSVAKRTTLPPRFHRTLGRYVVAKIDQGGSTYFNKTPFRHSTKIKAIEEASRLNLEFNAPFGIFRCLDIVDVKLNNGPIELAEKEGCGLND